MKIRPSASPVTDVLKSRHDALKTRHDRTQGDAKVKDSFETAKTRHDTNKTDSFEPTLLKSRHD